MDEPTGEVFCCVFLQFKTVGVFVFDPFFAVGTFVSDRCLGGAVATSALVAAFAAAAVAVAEGFGGEGGD